MVEILSKLANFPKKRLVHWLIQVAGILEEETHHLTRQCWFWRRRPVVNAKVVNLSGSQLRSSWFFRVGQVSRFIGSIAVIIKILRKLTKISLYLISSYGFFFFHLKKNGTLFRQNNNSRIKYWRILDANVAIICLLHVTVL